MKFNDTGDFIILYEVKVDNNKNYCPIENSKLLVKSKLGNNVADIIRFKDKKPVSYDGKVFKTVKEAVVDIRRNYQKYLNNVDPTENNFTLYIGKLNKDHIAIDSIEKIAEYLTDTKVFHIVNVDDIDFDLVGSIKLHEDTGNNDSKYALFYYCWDQGWDLRAVEKNKDGTLCYINDYSRIRNFIDSTVYTGQTFETLADALAEVRLNMPKYLKCTDPNSMAYSSGFVTGCIVLVELNDKKDGWTDQKIIFKRKGSKLIRVMDTTNERLTKNYKVKKPLAEMVSKATTEADVFELFYNDWLDCDADVDDLDYAFNLGLSGKRFPAKRFVDMYNWGKDYDYIESMYEIGKDIRKRGVKAVVADIMKDIDPRDKKLLENKKLLKEGIFEDVIAGLSALYSKATEIADSAKVFSVDSKDLVKDFEDLMKEQSENLPAGLHLEDTLRRAKAISKAYNELEAACFDLQKELTAAYDTCTDEDLTEGKCKDNKCVKEDLIKIRVADVEYNDDDGYDCHVLVYAGDLSEDELEDLLYEAGNIYVFVNNIFRTKMDVSLADLEPGDVLEVLD